MPEIETRTVLKKYSNNLFWCLRLFLGTYALIGVMDFITVYNAARQQAPFDEIIREVSVLFLLGSIFVVLVSLFAAVIIHWNERAKGILGLICVICILLVFVFSLRFFDPHLPKWLYGFGFTPLLFLILFGNAFHYYVENLARIGWVLATLLYASLIVLTPESFLAISHWSDKSRTVPPDSSRKDPLLNVILITFDSLNAKNMSLYGYSRKTTPFFEELARTSYVFQRAIACIPETESSTVSIFTSKYPCNHGAMSFPVSRFVQKESLLSTLRQASYHTIWVSDCGSGHANPLYNGLWPGVDYCSVDRLPRFLVSGFYNFLSNKQGSPFNLIVSPFYLPGLHIWWNLTFKEGVEQVFLRTLEILKDAARPPFLLYVRACAPEGYEGSPWRNFSGTFTNKLEKSPSITHKYYGSEGAEQHVSPSLDVLKDKYDESILFADSNLRFLIDGLKKNGLYDNSVIIVSSDHGESIEKAWWGHDSLNSVPLLIHLPGQEEGRVIDTPVSHIDIAPTVLGLLHLPVPHWMEGESLLPVMHGRVSECMPKFTLNSAGQKSKVGVFYKDYKLTYDVRSGETELYDLKKDPGEENNLSCKETACCSLLTNFGLQWLFYNQPNGIPFEHKVKWVLPGTRSTLRPEIIRPEAIKVGSEHPEFQKQFLVDGREDTFWHVCLERGPFPREEIQIELESLVPVNVCRIRPRRGEPQVWTGNSALFSGSNEGKNWTPLAGLSLPQGIGDDWLSFELENNTPYWYYKLNVIGPEFCSVAEIELGRLGYYSLPEALGKLTIDVDAVQFMTPDPSSQQDPILVGSNLGKTVEAAGSLSFTEQTGKRGITGWSDENYLHDDSFSVGGKALSVGFWIYLAEPNPVGSLVIDNDHRADEGWAFILSGDTVSFYIGKGLGRGDFVTTTPLSTGGWHWIVGVNGGGALHLYVGGRLNVVKEGIEGNILPRKGISIGRCYSLEGLALSSTTVLKDVFFTETALTAEQIGRLYQLTR